MISRRLLTGVFGLLAIGYLLLAAYVITGQDIEELLICADSGGLSIPFSKNLCRGYLLRFRGSPVDIERLQKGTGASFVLQGLAPAEEREQTLKYLIGKGLRVNEIDAQQLTPLHAAVLANEPIEVEILLRNGADPHAQDLQFRLTPLELALRLAEKNQPPADRQAVISHLRRFE